MDTPKKLPPGTNVPVDLSLNASLKIVRCGMIFAYELNTQNIPF